MITSIYKLTLPRIIMLILYIQCVQISAEIHAEIDFEVKGNGFHRTFIYRVYFKNFINNNCQVAIYIELPSALYINADEIAELHRHETSTVCSTGNADVELFTEKADWQNVTACTSVSLPSSNLTFPIHQRYQYAHETGGYINVTVPKPKLLLGCRDRIQGHRVSKVELCQPCVDLMAKWREIPYHTRNNDDYIWSIPLGNTSFATLVTYITLLVTIVGAVSIGCAIRTNALQNRPKKD